ncbi:hypothetical protein M422DRAFT_270257 [Sphaerobolus stellatus SS14]|uniref:Uncharacterized protein n=1 Tax=Sphaerobolus stellatus (strain SS14) TaxID=990650 RepID=A0A0C9UTJ6_SPHS4|nr:hypothetical protein M422DRAFT_270257 [Sphaerobolus stellatus SS14]
MFPSITRWFLPLYLGSYTKWKAAYSEIREAGSALPTVLDQISDPKWWGVSSLVLCAALLAAEIPRDDQFALILGDGDIHPVTQLEKILHDLFSETRGIGTLDRDFCEEVVRWFKLTASHACPQWKYSGDILEYSTTGTTRLREVSRTSMGEVGAALINSVLVVQNGQGIGEQEAMM